MCRVITKIKLMWKKHLPGLHESKHVCRLNANPCWGISQQYIYDSCCFAVFQIKAHALDLVFHCYFHQLSLILMKNMLRNFGMWNRLKGRQESNSRAYSKARAILLHFWEKLNKAVKQLFRYVKYFPRS